MSKEKDKVDSFDLEDHGIYLLFGEITNESVKGAIEWIIKENIKQKCKELSLIINSVGGELPAAFSLIDIMAGSKIPIKTVGLGEILSCGLIIFLAGEKGSRTLTPNTSILSHQFSWGTGGKEHELIATKKEIDMVGDRVLSHYKKHTGLSEKVIREKLLPPQDVWLSASEAKTLNITDKVHIFGTGTKKNG